MLRPSCVNWPSGRFQITAVVRPTAFRNDRASLYGRLLKVGPSSRVTANATPTRLAGKFWPAGKAEELTLTAQPRLTKNAAFLSPAQEDARPGAECECPATLICEMVAAFMRICTNEDRISAGHEKTVCIGVREAND